MNLKTKIEGFTITELLVTMVLTSIALTFAYSTLTNIQKLFSEYRSQNNFISESVRLKSIFDFESLKSHSIIKQEEHIFHIHRNNKTRTLIFGKKFILIKHEENTDTFHFSPEKIDVRFEKIENPSFQNKLVNNIAFDIDYSKQVFKFRFNKDYNSDVKIFYNELEK